MQNQYLEDLLHEVNLITRKVEGEFGRFSVDQLNWKPSSDQWSIAQCLDHLIQTNRQYFPLLEGIANGTRKKSFWEKLPGLPAFFGKMMLKALDPSNQKKLKAPASFKPGASTLPPSIVSDFVQHQQQLARLIKATDLVEHEKTIVSSPVSGLITFSLKDAISIMVVHEERHFLQAKRLLQAPGFPLPTDQAVPLATPARPSQQNRPDRPTRSDRPSRPDRPGGSDRPSRSDRPSGADRPSSSDRRNQKRTSHPDRPSGSGSPSRPPGHQNRPSRPDRPDNQNRPGSPGSADRPGGSDRPKRRPRPPRPNRSDRPTQQSQ